MPAYQTTWEDTYAIAENLFLERNTLAVYKIKATLKGVYNNVQARIKIYSGNDIVFDLTPNNNKINTTFIMLNNVFCLYERFSIKFPSNGNLYIRTTDSESFAINVDSEITVKYLNFDS